MLENLYKRFSGNMRTSWWYSLVTTVY